MLALGGSSDYRVGLFCVKRKDDMLRLMVDPYHSNLVCRRPLYTGLPSARSLGKLRVERGHKLQFHSGDVEVCFYQYLPPESVRFLFGMAPIQKRSLPLDMQSHPDFVHLGSHGPIYLRIIV